MARRGRGPAAIALLAAWATLLATSAMLLAAPAAPARSRGGARTRVSVILTTGDLHYALHRMASLRFASGSPPASAPVIDVDDAIHLQRIIGFGAAMTDSSAWLIHNQLPARSARWLMRRLFGAGGISLTLLRVPMGASDFTANGRPYSYDDLPPGQNDPQLRRFSIAHDRAYILPLLRRARALQPAVKVLATPWSPPGWMKVNDALDNFQDRGLLLGSSYEPLARYFVHFVKAYRAAGVPVWALTPQNEPQAATPYPGLNIDAGQEATFVDRFLAPSLHRAGLRPRIFGLDTGANLSYAAGLMAGAWRNLSGLAWHCYGGTQIMSQVHAIDPRLEQLVSECSPGIIPYPASEAAISALQNWASAVSLWNLALDPAGGPVEPPNSACGGCTGLVTISEQTHRLMLTANFYELAQLSRYISPGAVRVASTRFVHEFTGPGSAYGVSPGIDDVAFLNRDGNRVLVVYDNSPVPVTFAVRWRGRYVTYTIDPGSTVTFTWR